jgi:hypothetical protein
VVKLAEPLELRARVAAGRPIELLARFTAQMLNPAQLVRGLSLNSVDYQFTGLIQQPRILLN